MTLTDYLKENHAPIFGAIVFETLNGARNRIIYSFQEIPSQKNTSLFTPGSGPHPLAIVQVPPPGAYVVGLKEGSPFPMGIRLRDPEQKIPDGPNGQTLGAYRMLRYGVERRHGLVTTFLGYPAGVESGTVGHVEDDWETGHAR